MASNQVSVSLNNVLELQAEIERYSKMANETNNLQAIAKGMRKAAEMLELPLHFSNETFKATTIK